MRIEMHGIVGYIIIGACVVAALVAVASFVIDMRQSQRGAEKRRRLSSRLTGK
ncbi:MAG: hypothetical protein J0L85_21690 [Zoogloea sp.]|nr:hypothetical protein [Zoogloea sp.]